MKDQGKREKMKKKSLFYLCNREKVNEVQIAFRAAGTEEEKQGWKKQAIKMPGLLKQKHLWKS